MGKLKGDASTIFQNTGNKYEGHGFDKLPLLIEAFAGKGKMDAACTMLGFFGGFDQVACSPHDYAQALRAKIKVFDESGNTLSHLLQVMIALRGLGSEYADYVNELTLGRRQAVNTILADTTESCNANSSPLYTDTTPAARAVDRSSPLSKPVRDATDNTNTRPPPPSPPPNPYDAIRQLSDWAIEKHWKMKKQWCPVCSGTPDNRGKADRTCKGIGSL